MNSQSSWPFFTREEVDKVSSVLLSNKVNYWTGKECRKFEKEFAAWVGVEYAVSLANGTVALELAIKGLGIGSGDEVIVTSRTFIASVSAIINSGAIPIFVDLDRDSQNISIQEIEHAITPNTKAILCVHFAGWPCEMNSIIALADRYSLYTIEDCAQAHGAIYRGMSVGSFGDIGCWSFCQDKIITTGGEGGMVTTNNRNLWSKIWAYKDHGKNYDAVHERHSNNNSFQWLHDSFGTNARMTEMQATIGRVQLKRMVKWHDARNKNANTILDCCEQFPSLFRVPRYPEYIEHGWYKCYVFVRPENLIGSWSRDRIIEEINRQGVPCYQGSCSEVYLEKAFDGTGFRPKQRLPIAKELGETSLMFLVHPTLTKAEIHQTCDAIIGVVAELY